MGWQTPVLPTACENIEPVTANCSVERQLWNGLTWVNWRKIAVTLIGKQFPLMQQFQLATAQ